MSTNTSPMPSLPTAAQPDNFLARVRQAHSVLPAEFRVSPVVEIPCGQIGLCAPVILKLEQLNPIRSFKGRGASWYVQQFSDLYTARNLNGSSAPRIVCASAGNFGQGLAHACSRYGLKLTVFAPASASTVKVKSMIDLGAEVVLEGEDFDSAKSRASEYARLTRASFVEDGSEPALVEGAATIAAELLEQESEITCLVIPVGNGSLINGIAKYTKLTNPEIKIIGVCPAGAPSMEQSFRLERPIATASVETIADGLAVRIPVPEAVSELCRWVDDIVLVSDDFIRASQRHLATSYSLLSEPSGAAGIAALVQHGKYLSKFVGKDKKFGTVLCGASLGIEEIRGICS